MSPPEKAPQASVMLGTTQRGPGGRARGLGGGEHVGGEPLDLRDEPRQSHGKLVASRAPCDDEPIGQPGSLTKGLSGAFLSPASPGLPTPAAASAPGCPLTSVEVNKHSCPFLGYENLNRQSQRGPTTSHELTAQSCFSFFFLSFFFFFLLLFRATPVAHGDSQARGPIGAVAASLHHSHGNVRSEPGLRPTPQLIATDP